MDRSTQIIAVLVMLLFGSSAIAQQGVLQRHKGVKAYPVYHLQGLEFNTDSTAVGLYGWLRAEDRLAVLGLEMDELVSDSLTGLSSEEPVPVDALEYPQKELGSLATDSSFINTAHSLDSSSTWDDSYDFDPDWDGVDTVGAVDMTIDMPIDSMRQDSVSLSPLFQDSLTTVGLPTDSLRLELEMDVQELPLDSIANAPLLLDTLAMDTIPAISIDSLLIDSPAENLPQLKVVNAVDSISSVMNLNDSIGVVPVAPEIIESAPDTIFNSIEDIEVEELKRPVPAEPLVTPVDTMSKVMDSSTGKILIKSDPDMLGGQTIERTTFDSSVNRRIMMDPQETRTVVTEKVVREPSVETRVITVPAKERPAEYTGQYAGLSQVERERQLRLDAESRRKTEAAKIDLEKRRLAADIAADKAAQRTADIATEPSSQQMTDSLASGQKTASTAVQNVSTPTRVPLVIPVVVPTDAEPVVIVQRDTLTEKAVAQLAARLDAEARTDSMQRQAESKRIDARFDRMERKMDTLLNALGKKVVLDKTEYAIPKEDLNIYFAINSHSITGRQLMELEDYLRQLKDLSGYQVVLSGYADNSGNLEYNRMLVEKRISAVQEAILKMGVAPTELLINNYGKQKANDQKTYNQMDRKVSIQIFSAE